MMGLCEVKAGNQEVQLGGSPSSLGGWGCLTLESTGLGFGELGINTW